MLPPKFSVRGIETILHSGRYFFSKKNKYRGILLNAKTKYFCKHGNIYMFFQLHLFPSFWFLKKTALCENSVSGTVLMIQLTQNSPTCAYIGHFRISGNRVMRGLGVLCTSMYYIHTTYLLYSEYIKEELMQLQSF